MFLHKYNTDHGTLFLVSEKRSPGKVTLSLGEKKTISGDAVKNLLSNITSKFKEEAIPEEPVEDKKEEAPVEEKKEEKKTAALATIIRQYATTLKD